MLSVGVIILTLRSVSILASHRILIHIQCLAPWLQGTLWPWPKLYKNCLKIQDKDNACWIHSDSLELFTVRESASRESRPGMHLIISRCILGEMLDGRCILSASEKKEKNLLGPSRISSCSLQVQGVFLWLNLLYVVQWFSSFLDWKHHSKTFQNVAVPHLKSECKYIMNIMN